MAMTNIRMGLRRMRLPVDDDGKVEIPNCQRRELPRFFKEIGFKKGVEIGTYLGDFARWFGKEGLELHTVDPYLAYDDYHEGRKDFQKRQEEIYKTAQRKLEPFPNVKIVRKTSMEALADFEDNSLDFVYIDGHHGFKYVAEDIYCWSKKVREGGIISGHDYANYIKPGSPYTLQVKFAVDAYVKAFRIKPWYVLGRQERLPGEIRETFRSWMWYKTTPKPHKPNAEV